MTVNKNIPAGYRLTTSNTPSSSLAVDSNTEKTCKHAAQGHHGFRRGKETVFKIKASQKNKHKLLLKHANVTAMHNRNLNSGTLISNFKMITSPRGKFRKHPNNNRIAIVRDKATHKKNFANGKMFILLYGNYFLLTIKF